MSKHTRRGLPSIEEQDFAAALHEEGHKDRPTDSRSAHKTSQLCRQVQRALNLGLAELGADPILDQVFIELVTPAPGCAHLLAHFVTPADRSVSEVLSSLSPIMGRLRAQVARAISRKQTPELSFVPAWRVGGEDD